MSEARTVELACVYKKLARLSEPKWHDTYWMGRDASISSTYAAGVCLT